MIKKHYKRLQNFKVREIVEECHQHYSCYFCPFYPLLCRDAISKLTSNDLLRFITYHKEEK